MKTKESIFYFEYHRLMAKNKCYLAIALVLLMAMAQINFLKISKNKEEIKVLKHSEKHYPQQNTFPNQETITDIQKIHLFTLPTETLFLLNFKAYDNLIATIDEKSYCKIYEGKKTGAMNYLSGGYISYSGILFLLLSLISITSGSEIFKNLQPVKFLCSVKKKKFHIIMLKMIASRLFLILIFTTITISCTMILAIINGIISNNLMAILNLLLLSIPVTAFFLLLGGAVTATIIKKGPGTAAITGIYIIMVVVFPWFISIFPGNVFHTDYEIKKEEKQLKILNITNNALKDDGKPDSTDNEKNELMETIELEQQEMIISKVNEYRKMSMLLPSTLFLATANELSGYGVNNFCDFYRFLETQRCQYRNFHKNKYKQAINKSDPNLFEPNHRNIFQAHPDLPRYYAAGIGLTFIYIGVLGFIAFHFSGRRFFQVNKDKYSMDIFEVRRGKLNVLFAQEKSLTRKIFGFMAGRAVSDTELYVINRGGRSNASKYPYIYLVNPCYFSSLPVPALKRFLFGNDDGDISSFRPHLLFKYAVEKANKEAVIIMDDFLTGSDPLFIEIIFEIQASKLLSFVISDDFYLCRSLIGESGELFLFENDLSATKVVERFGSMAHNPSK